MSDPFNPTGSNTAEQTMLLRLIDAKFETLNTKVDGVGSSVKALSEAVAQITVRFDSHIADHEHRLASIESVMAQRALQVREFEDLKKTVATIDNWKTEEQTTSRNAGKWGGAIWGACGSGVTAGLIFLATAYFQAQPPAKIDAGAHHGSQITVQGG